MGVVAATPGGREGPPRDGECGRWIRGLWDCGDTSEDGTKVAGELQPLADGGLPDRLNQVLDDRSDPRAQFDPHRISAAGGGFYIVLEVFGRRRPHMANDGRYYVRRNLQVRRMTDAEVAEAQLDRFRRDHEAGVPGLAASSIAEIPIEAAGRIHRGLRPSELSLYRQETGESRPPGWLSVVAAAAPLAADTLDLQRVPARELNQLSVHHWYPDAPLQHMLLRPRSRSLEGRLPERDDVYPRYLLRVWDDGLMEFGTMLKLAIQPTPPDTDRRCGHRDSRRRQALWRHRCQ